MKIGIYLGDIKNAQSMGDLTYELSFVDEILTKKTPHEFIFYYFGKKNVFKYKNNAKFVNLKYYKKPEISFQPFCIKTYKTPFLSLNHRLLKDKVNLVCFLVPYLHEHIEIPYFAIVRDVAHRILPHFPEFSTNQVFVRMERKLNLFLTSATKIITCNQIAKNDIKTLYDVIDENIITMPMPYPNWLDNTKEDKSVLEENNLSKNSYILYPAQFWAHKNHIRLILASQLMKEQNINLKVVFTGLDKGNKNYLTGQIKLHDLKNNVIITNFITREQLCSLYKNAYAMVYPSLAGPDSIVALEAMYFKCPVLISYYPGYIQQLKKSALYFNPLDESDIVEKIKHLNDLSVKDEIISNSTILIKENTFKNYTDKLINLIDEFYMIRQCWSFDERYEIK